MKAARAVVLIAVLAALSAHGAEVRVTDIGLQGVYSQSQPTRFRVTIANPDSRPQTLHIEYRLSNSPENGNPRQPSIFTQQVTVGGEKKVLDVPLFVMGHDVIEVLARDASGNVVGRDYRKIPAATFGGVVAVYCTDEHVCQQVVGQIDVVGEEQKQRYNYIRVDRAVFREPAEEWWAYTVADVLIIAGPTASLSPAQRTAFEGYLRQGGVVLLLEQEIADPSFLAEYRRTPDRITQEIGTGTLHRFANADQAQIRNLLTETALHAGEKGVASVMGRDELGWARMRLSTTFTFPTLLSIILWLAIYIAILGPVNFAVLRKLGRLEWGWITVPAIGVLFSIGLYVFSAANKPSHFGLDEVAVYWMDDRSPLAAGEIALRVSAPQRRKVKLEIGAPAVLMDGFGEGTFGGVTSISEIFVARSRPIASGWHMQLGPPALMGLGLLRWSFRDLGFRQMRTLPGTVSRISATKLENGTDQAFRDAMYVDAEHVYLLGPVAPGQEIELGVATQKPLSDYTGKLWAPAMFNSRLGGGWSPQRPNVFEPEDTNKLLKQPFSITEFIRGWPKDSRHVFQDRSGLFFGLSEEPVLASRLTDVPAVRKSYSITIISFAPQP